jgi:hypothetical protein
MTVLSLCQVQTSCKRGANQRRATCGIESQGQKGRSTRLRAAWHGRSPSVVMLGTPGLLLATSANTAAIRFDAGNLRAPEQAWCRLDRR